MALYGILLLLLLLRQLVVLRVLEQPGMSKFAQLCVWSRDFRNFNFWGFYGYFNLEISYFQWKGRKYQVLNLVSHLEGNQYVYK